MKLPLAFFKEGPCLLFGPVHLENVGQQEGEDRHTSDQRSQQRNGYPRGLKIGDQYCDNENC